MRKIFLCAALSVVSGLMVSGIAAAADAAGAMTATPSNPVGVQGHMPREVPVPSQPPAAQPASSLPMSGIVRPWGYTGPNGSVRWGDLEPSFSLCKSGMRQSPINIVTFYQETMPSLEADYRPVPLTVTNTGNTMRVGYAPGSGFSVDGFRYELRRIEFHTPSEHYMDGASWPMEAQFVHQGSDGSLAIIAVMMKIGKQNPTFAGMLQNLPANAGAVRKVDSVSFLADALMPENLDYYAYDGSLTSPPCSEGVRWFVLKDPVEVSEGQIKAFQARFPFNARPVQPLNGRVVTGD